MMYTVQRRKVNERTDERWEMKRGLRCNKWGEETGAKVE